ncbi:MAG TPA: hypothetical protein VJG83_01640 [archaeon]|nr:hypothetical protein [archaeon]
MGIRWGKFLAAFSASKAATHLSSAAIKYRAKAAQNIRDRSTSRYYTHLASEADRLKERIKDKHGLIRSKRTKH